MTVSIRKQDVRPSDVEYRCLTTSRLWIVGKWFCFPLCLPLVFSCKREVVVCHDVHDMLRSAQITLHVARFVLTLREVFSHDSSNSECDVLITDHILSFSMQRI